MTANKSVGTIVRHPFFHLASIPLISADRRYRPRQFSVPSVLVGLRPLSGTHVQLAAI